MTNLDEDNKGIPKDSDEDEDAYDIVIKGERFIYKSPLIAHI